MNGRNRGNGKMSKLTDRLFGDKKRSMGIALGIAGTVYVLALLFGNGATAKFGILSAPIMGFLAFGAMFLVMGFQLINPFSTPGFMDFGELFFGLCYTCGMIPWFLCTGFWQLFGENAHEAAATISIIAGLWCALCQVHNMRH